ncbi:unnamed protein product [Cylindrotheca closterium]|uniref:Uncharacterized protein n=1 Tax=Cylindrotheca closterium TaxID=2856 RepID=A0AAD2FUS0_9STRA|nr:unnamed protein product [Cylindrotheca closterium]
MMDQPRSLRRKKNLPDLQYSSTVGRLFESTTSATSAAPIASVTSNSVVHFTSAPTASPTKTKSEMPSLAPTLVPGRTEDPTADPTNSPTIFPSTSPSTPPTTVQSMNSALSEEETAKQSKIIFLSTFLGVYVLLGGGMAIRWLWR